ncbi:MAG TPA: MBL fold metallo-hydrolase [Candidatus Acidoferrum sp.]|nr:MBL fold metallo-hydrolase [Candidatus Acidoferrum sp.]
MKLFQETENLSRFTRFGVINCFLVREADGFTLVDAGLRGSAGNILNAASRLGAPIRRIVLTHAHIDHIGSLDPLMAALPACELAIGNRESRLLAKDLSLDPGEHGKSLLGFTGAKSRPNRLLLDGDRIGSLLAIASPGHTPGHIAFLDVRDNALIAGDAFTTQTGIVVAGVFKPLFPFPALFSWNAVLAAKSAAKLRELNPSLLAVGHGPSIPSPARQMDVALEEAFRQHPEAR